MNLTIALKGERHAIEFVRIVHSVTDSVDSKVWIIPVVERARKHQPFVSVQSWVLAQHFPKSVQYQKE
ncbi:hypothetical protein [Sporisorium scitamineum]|uniref:Uncharacterized protein n=1 Tax=Sporisorium scitamineum TaxID=49012 RepID=A0A0F7S8S2_9BASI|nr:hypothetical protein [Sporisorium scitamineum]